LRQDEIDVKPHQAPLPVDTTLQSLFRYEGHLFNAIRSRTRELIYRWRSSEATADSGHWTIARKSGSCLLISPEPTLFQVSEFLA